MNNKKFEFEIKNGHLLVGDDEIYLNWVNNICIRESAMREGEYAIHINTSNMTLELYYTGAADEVYDAFQELSESLKNELLEFYSCFRTELINRRNVQEVTHSGGVLINSNIKIEFKRGEDLIHRASKSEFKQIKEAIFEYKANRKQNATI